MLLVDLGLHNAGWAFARTGAIHALHEVIGNRAGFCWARDIGTVQIITSTANPNSKALAERIYEDGPTRADGEKLIQLLDEVFQLAGSRLYSELDLLMGSLDLSRSAPEYLVGILRATSNDVHHLLRWKDFLLAVKVELAGRKLDAERILIGLL